MTSIIIDNSEIKRIRFSDCDLSGAKFMNTYIIDLDFTDKVKTKLDEKTFFDKIKLRKKDRDEYEGIYMTYETIADKFEENSLKNNFGEYYYLSQKTKRNVLDFAPKIMSYIYCATCGYGERPLNSIYFSFAIIFIFGLLYFIFGIKIDDNIISVINGGFYKYNFNDMVEAFKQGLLLSVNLFSGVGANESVPVNFSEIIASFEIIFGVIMMGIGTGTIVRKLVR